MHSTTDQRPHCAPGNRCHRWRSCDQCAAIRQARIATAAEKLATVAGSIDWTTLEPFHHSPAALIAQRDRFLKLAKPAGAIWTVEVSPSTGNLHCNILTPPGLPPHMPAAAQHRIIKVADPRHVGAYISKRAQVPDPARYPGRAYGTAGPLWQWLTAREQLPTVQAAAVQRDISAANSDPEPPRAERRIFCAADLDRCDYREIMARRLPDIVSAAPRPRPTWAPT